MLGQAPSPSTCNPTKPVNGRANAMTRLSLLIRGGVEHRLALHGTRLAQPFPCLC